MAEWDGNNDAHKPLRHADGSYPPQYFDEEYNNGEGACRVLTKEEMQKSQQIGSNVVENVVYQRDNGLPPDTTEVVCDIQGVTVELLSLSMGTDSVNSNLIIEAYDKDNNLQAMGIARRDGTTVTGSVTPGVLKTHSSGENDFFRNALYDSGNDYYTIAMKRQCVFGNGIKISVRNGGDTTQNICISTMLAIKGARN